MIKYLIIFIFLFSVSDVHAETCKQKLISILKNAKVAVNGVLAKGTPCNNAALVGRKNGPPGCFPPDLITLGNVLTPLHDAATAACNGLCDTEGKKSLCKEATKKSHLKEVGIDGVISWINSHTDFASNTAVPASHSATKNVDI